MDSEPQRSPAVGGGVFRFCLVFEDCLPGPGAESSEAQARTAARAAGSEAHPPEPAWQLRPRTCWVINKQEGGRGSPEKGFN